MNDKKNFRDKLHTQLKEGTYETIYAILGSNDALSSISKFYRNVTRILDLIRETSPNVDIVLCEILPRGPDIRRNLPEKKFQDIQKWITEANKTLQDVSDHYPYVRFLGFPGFSPFIKDGLHLNPQGSRVCYEAIASDSYQPPGSASFKTDTLENDWPTLSDVNVQQTPTINRLLYSEIAQVEGSPSPTPEAEYTSMNTCTSSNLLRKKVVCVKYRSWHKRLADKKRFQQRRRKWLKKRIDIRHKAVDSNESDNSPVGHRKTQAPVKRRKERAQWLSCPDCGVLCSRDDFLLDHIIRHHTKSEKGLKRMIGKDNMVSASMVTVGENTEETSKEKTDQTVEEVTDQTAEEVTDQTEEEVTDQTAEEVTDQTTYEQTRMFSNMSLAVQNNADTSRLKLLLSNDV